MTTLVPAPEAPEARRIGSGVFNPRSLLTSLPEALRKLDPRTMWRSPVMFVVLVGSVLDAANAPALLRFASGAIVGTSLKTGAFVDPSRVSEVVAAARAARDSR